MKLAHFLLSQGLHWFSPEAFSNSKQFDVICDVISLVTYFPFACCNILNTMYPNRLRHPNIFNTMYPNRWRQLLAISVRVSCERPETCARGKRSLFWVKSDPLLMTFRKNCTRRLHKKWSRFVWLMSQYPASPVTDLGEDLERLGPGLVRFINEQSVLFF